MTDDEPVIDPTTGATAEAATEASAAVTASDPTVEAATDAMTGVTASDPTVEAATDATAALSAAEAPADLPVAEAPVRLAIGVDVGGSGIKAAAVDVATGRLVGPRLRVPTPDPSTPSAVVGAIARLVHRIERASGAEGVPVGIGVPCVVLDGTTWTAANVDKGWIGFAAEDALQAETQHPVTVINDADAAGLAEMRFGAGRGSHGVVFVLTLGTGLGSGMFVDGRLVPNTELGHMEIRGRDAERRSAAAARVRRGLSWKAWAADLDEHLRAIEALFWPTLIVIGGGVSRNAAKFVPRLTVRAPVITAALLNDAGIVGAAMAAEERAEANGSASPRA